MPGGCLKLRRGALPSFTDQQEGGYDARYGEQVGGGAKVEAETSERGWQQSSDSQA